MKAYIAFSLIGLQLAIAAPAFAVEGRAYVETERKIVRMTKQMVADNRETGAFADLLKELDAIDLSESTRDFWRLAHEVKDAMAEEVRQGRVRIEKEGASQQQADASGAVQPNPGAGSNPTEDALSKRIHRMEMIVLETEGLRNPLSMSEESVIVRYRHLVGEFHSLLQADVDETRAEIDALKERQRAARD
jgi:hypothetical protein